MTLDDNLTLRNYFDDAKAELAILQKCLAATECDLSSCQVECKTNTSEEPPIKEDNTESSATEVMTTILKQVCPTEITTVYNNNIL